MRVCVETPPPTLSPMFQVCFQIALKETSKYNLRSEQSGTMKELLAKMVGQEVDVVCTGASSLRGTVVKVEGNVLHLKDDDGNVCYVALDKIVAVWEKRDKERQPGFVFKS